MFTTNSIDAFSTDGRSRDELSMDDIMGLVKNKKIEDVLPEIQYNEEDIKELEEFCQKHGIVGFNCGNMNPKAALEILKSRIGNVDNVIKNMENQGHQLVGKNYDHKKQLLNG